MQSLLQTVETAAFLRNARIGNILSPAIFRGAVSAAKQLPPIASYAIAASVPNWLVERLDPHQPMVPNYQVIPTTDRRDFLMLVTLQCSSIQLRCVLQLSNPATQAFLSDALDHELFTMLLCIENTKQNAVVAVPMNLAAPQELRSHMTNAKPCSDGAAPALQLVYLASQAGFQPSFIEGHTVNDVVAVYAGTATEQDVDRALGSGQPGTADDGHPLH